jgi:tetratricopeptide (TPR) repeat protein
MNLSPLAEWSDFFPLTPADVEERMMAVNRIALSLMHRHELDEASSVLDGALAKCEEIKTQHCADVTSPNVKEMLDILLRARSVTYCNLGNVMRQRGNNKEAKKMYRKSLELEMKANGKPSANLMLNLSSLLLSTGNPAQAVSAAENAIELISEDKTPQLLSIAQKHLEACRAAVQEQK